MDQRKGKDGYWLKQPHSALAYFLVYATGWSARAVFQVAFLW
jgi:hypothetical protein